MKMPIPITAFEFVVIYSMPTTDELIKLRDSVTTQDLKEGFITADKIGFAAALATSWFVSHVTPGLRIPIYSSKSDKALFFIIHEGNRE